MLVRNTNYVIDFFNVIVCLSFYKLFAWLNFLSLHALFVHLETLMYYLLIMVVCLFDLDG